MTGYRIVTEMWVLWDSGLFLKMWYKVYVAINYREYYNLAAIVGILL